MRPISSTTRRSSSLPERPTNGRACRSSSAPGPSPTNSSLAVGLPVPNTTWVRVVARPQRTHVLASSATAARSDIPPRLRPPDHPADVAAGDATGDPAHDLVGDGAEALGPLLGADARL